MAVTSTPQNPMIFHLSKPSDDRAILLQAIHSTLCRNAFRLRLLNEDEEPIFLVVIVQLLQQ